MLYAAAALIAALGIAHSILGERFILIRLLRRDNLPKLFGGTEFTARTLRFAWHLTTILALCLALLLIQLAGRASAPNLASTIGLALIVAGVLPLVYTRGRHLSWVVLFVSGGLCLSWAAA